MTEKIQYKKTIATAMASFAFLTFGILSLVSCSAMDINSVITFLTKSVPAACVFAFLGYLLGNIFDDKRIIRKRKWAKEPAMASQKENVAENIANGELDEG